MSKPKIRTVVVFIFIICLAGGSAYVLGLKASEIIQGRESLKLQAEMTESILKKMNGVAIGYKLPDFELSDLDGNRAKLSQIVSDKALISFMQPNCGYCDKQINALNETVPADKQGVFIIISDGWRDDLLLMRADHNIQCHFLHDAESRLCDSLGIISWPFNMIVNQELEIIKVLNGSLPAGHLDDIYDDLLN